MTNKKITVFFSLAIVLFMFLMLLASCSNTGQTSGKTSNDTGLGTGTVVGNEIEATEFQGVKLTPIKEQNNNAWAGTQRIERDTYILTVNGLVDNPLALSYDQLLAYPQQSYLMDLNCVEGWNFTAKWTGPELNSIFADAGVKPEAKIVIFYTTDFPDGYTSLDFNFITENNIIIALKLNDITLPEERGFPFQVVAENKYGYKWAKWVTRIELSSDTDFRGWWEKMSYNNNAEVGGPTRFRRN
jgi:DMSO/TMAO reductase YedYZ molybdopterin-dependent catalytic subunit